MGKGGARLVTTRRRNFSASISEGLPPTLSATPAAGDDGSSRALLLTGGPYNSAACSSAGGDAEGGAKQPEQMGSAGQLEQQRCACVERANATVYLLCAMAFAPASLGFLPQFEEYYSLACYVFVIGSGGFLWVASWDAMETWALHRQVGWASVFL